MNAIMIDRKEKEEIFRETFFKCSSISEGIALAATTLNIEKHTARNYFMIVPQEHPLFQ